MNHCQNLRHQINSNCCLAKTEDQKALEWNRLPLSPLSLRLARKLRARLLFENLQRQQKHQTQTNEVSCRHFGRC